MSWFIFWSGGRGHMLQGGVPGHGPSRWIFSPLLVSHPDTLSSACLQFKIVACIALNVLAKFCWDWRAGARDFYVISFFSESDTPIDWTEPAAPRTVLMYFKGLIYIFWPGLARSNGWGLEICARLYFFLLSSPLVRATGSAAATTTRNFFLCCFYIYWSRLAGFGRRFVELFAWLCFFWDFAPPVCWYAPAAPSTQRNFFVGLSVILWMSLAGSSEPCLELFSF